MKDVDTARKLIIKVGENREIFLHGNVGNMAGNLVMAEYQKDVQLAIAKKRWDEANTSGCETVVTEDPSEYELMKEVTPKGKRTITLQDMILENM